MGLEVRPRADCGRTGLGLTLNACVVGGFGKLAGSGSYLPRWFRMKYGSFARSIVSSASLRSLSLRSMASCCVERAGHGGKVQGRLDRAGEGRGGTDSSAADSTGREIGAVGDAGLTCADATPAPPILLPCSRASINDMTTLSVRSTLRRSRSPRREKVASDLAGREAKFFLVNDDGRASF